MSRINALGTLPATNPEPPEREEPVLSETALARLYDFRRLLDKRLADDVAPNAAQL